MEARSLNEGVGGCSNGELHEHGDLKRMVESQEELPRLVVEIRI
jgi:hypothetical protein